MKILAIDPGTEESGWCLFEDGRVIHSGVYANEELLHAWAALGVAVTVAGITPESMRATA